IDEGGNMRKNMSILLLILMVIGLSVPFVGCGADSRDEETQENQTVAVERGDLIIDVTAAGNLALLRSEDLTFDLFYQEGTIQEVLVEEGDTVEAGQVLVRLDTSEWEDQLALLEEQLKAADRALTTRKRDLLQAKVNAKNADIALEKAEEPYSGDDIDSAEAAVDLAEASLEDSERQLEEAHDLDDEESINRLRLEVMRDDESLRSAEARLETMKENPDEDDIAIKQMQIELAWARVEDAQLEIEDAHKDLEEAQEDLEEAKGKSPVITAPFAGFVTRINVEGGDEILKGTVALQLADPNRFEADIMISEMDILQVKLDGEALVQVDALQGMSLPAKVTHISPTATIQQGVVNYKVKVEVESLEADMQEQQAEREERMQGTQQGELPERLKQAIEEGRITQEQAKQMMGRMEQGGQQRQMPSAMPDNFQLKEGLTVTVNLIVDQRQSVLLVPNSAITTQGRQTYVRVMLPDGTTEDRVLQAGISNWQYTEITEGLSEGENVIVPQGTTNTSTTPQQGRPSGGMFIPGMGRPH
ncbi:HlyD family efflux transporter periplasmic adaptor subunit, partial [Chloroflexota bacterium]